MKATTCELKNILDEINFWLGMAENEILNTIWIYKHRNYPKWNTERKKNYIMIMIKCMENWWAMRQVEIV